MQTIIKLQLQIWTDLGIFLRSDGINNKLFIVIYIELKDSQLITALKIFIFKHIVQKLKALEMEFYYEFVINGLLTFYLSINSTAVICLFFQFFRRLALRSLTTTPLRNSSWSIWQTRLESLQMFMRVILDKFFLIRIGLKGRLIILDVCVCLFVCCGGGGGGGGRGVDRVTIIA